MKRIGYFSFLAGSVLLTVFLASPVHSRNVKQVKKFPFYVYTEAKSKLNNFIPCGWMGDVGDMRMNERWGKNPYAGKSCIQIKYSAQQRQEKGWAGIYWLESTNNWGVREDGYDLTGAKKLFFYARGEKGGEVLEFKMGGLTGDYSDTGMATTQVVELTKAWELYSMDLSDQDLSFLIGGFCFSISSKENPDGCTFYLDEIYYSDKEKPLKK